MTRKEEKSESRDGAAPNGVDRRKFRFGAAVLLGVMLAAAVIGEWHWRRHRGPMPPSAAELAAWRREIAELHAEYRRRNREIFQGFSCELAQAGAEEFQTAEANADKAAADFAGFAACGKLIWLMARDEVCGGDGTREFLLERLGPEVIAPCAAGGRAVRECLERFRHELRESDNQFRADCARTLARWPEAEPAAAGERLARGLNDFAAGVTELTTDRVWAGTGIALEAMCWRQTRAALMRIAGRTAGKAAGSAAAPLVDGPLPVGDVIAVVGFAWCIRDVWAVQAELPAALRESLTRTIAAYRRDSRAEAERLARRMLAAAEAAAGEPPEEE